MKKAAVISNRIILNVTKELGETLRTNLSYKIFNSASRITGRPELIKTYARINDTVYSIPAGRTDLIPKDYEIIDKRVQVPVDFPEFNAELRGSQQDVWDAIEDCGIINAPVSWGKTFTGLAIAAKFGQKTLIVTHTTILRDQWCKEVEKVFGFKPSIIGTGKFQTDGPIVVGNVQTLTKVIDRLADMFGTVIIDECHHTPATTFSNILDKSKARYKIGLTGTLERKDQKHVLFEDYFGKILFKPKGENAMIPEVVLFKTDIMLPAGPNWANKITELETYNLRYQKLIVELADSAAAMGHKVLVVGGRTSFLEKAPSMSKYPAVFITGSITDLNEREKRLNMMEDEADILYGTMSIFSEGISQNDLSCLILATPVNNDPLLTQLIGRIVRLKEGKLTPLVIDINLAGTMADRQARQRLAHYIRKGYKVTTVNKLS